MGLVQLGFESIRGGTGLSIANEAVKKAGRDCIERPHIKKARIITFTISIKPVHDDDMNITIPVPNFSVSYKFPGVESVPVAAQFDKEGNIVVNTFDYEQPNQMGIDDMPNVIQMQNQERGQ